MHEMSICMSMMNLIADQQKQAGFSRVKRVIVELGALSHVDPEALQFCFDAAARGTSAEGGTLEIREVAASAWCHDCLQTVQIAEYGGACPRCDGNKLILQGGDEMKLKELEVV